MSEKHICKVCGEPFYLLTQDEIPYLSKDEVIPYHDDPDSYGCEQMPTLGFISMVTRYTRKDFHYTLSTFSYPSKQECLDICCKPVEKKATLPRCKYCGGVIHIKPVKSRKIQGKAYVPVHPVQLNPNCPIAANGIAMLGSKVYASTDELKEAFNREDDQDWGI